MIADPELISQLADATSPAMTHAQFIKAFKLVIEMVRKLEMGNEKDFKMMQAAIDALGAKLAADNSADALDMRSQCESMLQEWAAKIEDKVMAMDAALDAVEDGEDGKDGADARPEDVAPLVVPLVLAALPPDEEDTGDEIIAKINGANDLIEPGAVRGLAELERQVGENNKNGTGGSRVGWGAHPLVVKGLGSVIDKNTRVIDFEGSGISSVARSKDGVVTVTVSGGSSSFAVLLPTGTVDGTNKVFTFTSTPVVVILDNTNVMNKTNRAPDSTINWTGATTITLKVAPTFNIFAF